MTNKFDRIHTNTNRKYVIRNCPTYYINTCSDSKVKEQYCSKCTDCVMKQIVELAKGHTELCRNCEQQIKECDCADICNAYRLNNILQLLQIEEVE